MTSSTLRLCAALWSALSATWVCAGAAASDGEKNEPAESEGSGPKVTWVEEGAGSPASAEAPIDLAGRNGGASGAPKYLLQKIVIEGNRKTFKRVVLRHVPFTPGEVFSAADPRLEETRYRLLASGYFAQVAISLERGDREGWAALVIRVKERNTIVVKDLMLGVSEIEPYAYGSVGVAENSFLGTGVQVAASIVGSKDQFGYKLSLADDHFLDSDVGLHIEGRYADAVDFFGHDDVYVGSRTSPVQYAEMKYKRAGMRLGVGYTLLLDYFFWVDFRFEFLRADVPPPGSNTSFGETRPIDYGHLLPGNSKLSSIPFGVSRDTRDHPLLPSRGSFTELGVELSSDVVGSDYEFAKFTIAHETYFHLGKGHSLKLGLFAGFVMGEAPFYSKFFVGDFSSFIPSRLLELNFSHLQPCLLETTVQEMRYEDIAGSLDLEYSLPFYRGQGAVYGVNGFISLGLFILASRGDIRTEPRGYDGFEVVPMDLTANLGVRIDTRVGVFSVSVANLFAAIPGVRQLMAEK